MNLLYGLSEISNHIIKYYQMKQRIILILTTLLMLSLPAMPQKTLDLGECYRMAAITNSLSREKEAHTDIWRLKDENLAKGWLPTIDANANLVYNSEVIDMSGVFASVPVPGLADAIKPLPHEQYKITIDINQVLYDGGTIRSARTAEVAELRASVQQTETDLYKLKGQVNGYYFSALMLDKQRELLESYLELIKKKIRSMSSALENGVILRSDLDVLNSERIKLEQQLDENSIKRSAVIKSLSSLTGTDITDNTSFSIPPVTENISENLLRPELKLFDLRREQLEAGLDLLQSKRMPKAFGFATIGYGNPPGNNFFRDEFAPFYIFGAGIKWNIYDWNKVKNEKQQMLKQMDIIEYRKHDLSESLKRMLDSKNAEIRSIESMLERDKELIELRKRITATAESQYDNGTLTATEYLNELNSERQAVISYELHRISLSMAQVEYLNIRGDDPDQEKN